MVVSNIQSDKITEIKDENKRATGEMYAIEGTKLYEKKFYSKAIDYFEESFKEYSKSLGDLNCEENLKKLGFYLKENYCQNNKKTLTVQTVYEIFKLRGNAFFHLFKFKEAIKNYENALLIRNEDEDVINIISRCKLEPQAFEYNLNNVQKIFQI